MSKQLVSGKRRLRNTYWSLVGAASAIILSVQPVMAETIWEKQSFLPGDPAYMITVFWGSQRLPGLMEAVSIIAGIRIVSSPIR